jgi:hypothetical protein
MLPWRTFLSEHLLLRTRPYKNTFIVEPLHQIMPFVLVSVPIGALMPNRL